MHVLSLTIKNISNNNSMHEAPGNVIRVEMSFDIPYIDEITFV